MAVYFSDVDIKRGSITERSDVTLSWLEGSRYEVSVCREERVPVSSFCDSKSSVELDDSYEQLVQSVIIVMSAMTKRYEQATAFPLVFVSLSCTCSAELLVPMYVSSF
uniref:Uncharacterized protein n=1 Tax=Peronospora matthiolae TaxID=2874970 RepID=A0AAV1TVY5_9STRA